MSTDEKVDAWMPLWIGSYLADTMALSRDSHGGYLLLLFAYWRNKGPLDDNDEDLAGITKATPAEWRKLRQRLAKFFVIEDGLWSHVRADKELAKAGEHKAAAVKKAKAGAEAMWAKRRAAAAGDASGGATPVLVAANDGSSKHAPSIARAVPKQCPTPSPKRVETKKPPHPPAGGAFARFWDAWPAHTRKVARSQCEAKWEKKGCEPIADEVIAAVVAAKSSEAWRKSGGEFIPAPLVWLNQERWQAPITLGPAVTMPSRDADVTATYLREQAARAAEVEATRLARQGQAA